MQNILPSEARRILKVDRETLNKWVSQGRIKAQRVPQIGWRVFNRKEIETIAARLPIKRTRGCSLLTNQKKIK